MAEASEHLRTMGRVEAMDLLVDISGLALLLLAAALGIRVILTSFRGITYEQPLQGIPFSEQRRLLRLARSGKVIDGRDADLVRPVLEHQAETLRRIDKSHPVTLLSLAAFLIGGFLVFVIGEQGRPTGGFVTMVVVFAGAALVAAAISRSLRLRLLATARANGWHIPQDS